MTSAYSQQRRGQYHTMSGKPFYVAEVVPNTQDERGLAACASGIATVLHNSWQTKFVPGVLSEADLRAKVPTGRQVQRNIAQGYRHYLVAVDGIEPVTSPDQVLAFTCYEDYRPRRPTLSNPLRAAYPNIRDLESRDGMMTVESAVPRLALLRHVVEQANPKHKVSAYAEQQSPASVSFYKQNGFTRDEAILPAQLTETVGESEVTYVHMEAAAAGAVHELALIGLARYIDDV